MTNTSNTTVEPSVGESQTVEESPSPDAQSAATEGAAPNREERRDERTRSRLRETEQERDRYRDALVPHVRSAVEARLSKRLSDPAALWLLPELDPLSLLDDEMGVDQAKVDEAVAQLHERLPSTAKRFAGSVDGGTRASSADAPTWSSVIGR